MLSKFQFTLYRFSYVVKEPLMMPLYKGNVFRSRLGYFLRQVACLNTAGTPTCQQRCQFPQQCIYSRFFETPIPKDNPVMAGGNFAPHPFVLEPPLTPQTRYEPGETFCCHLILIGNAIDLLPWMVYTFDELGKRRIGVEGRRGRCQLDLVECLPSFSSEMSQPVYTDISRTMRDTHLTLTLDDVLKNAPSIGNTLELDFLTPARLKAEGSIVKELTFERLIRHLLMRIRLLAYFHCGEQPEVDFADLCEKACAVTGESQLHWLTEHRWSHRTKTRVPMGGFIGQIRFNGDFSPFLPLICLGEYLHVGHNTAFGFGKYCILQG